MKSFDVLIVGAGIYGITASVALRQRNYRVAVLNPDGIPHLLAASTDVSKVVRMEYGADVEYLDMVAASIEGWHAWNGLFGETLYHEVGFLMLCRQPVDRGLNSFEQASYDNLLERGFKPERLTPVDLSRRFPALNPDTFPEAFFNPRAGYAESGRVVRALADHARQLGVDILERCTVADLELDGEMVTGVRTREGQRFSTGHVLVCAGAYTPGLLPELKPLMKVTGHPVFHLRPSRPALFRSEYLPVFTADISNTGWYGFPLHPREEIVKIANHGIGVELNPETDARVVTAEDEQALRAFLKESIPSLADDPVVYTRRCLYNDTLDGHFWIDRHPTLLGLSVAAGGSGHAFKMAPVLGDMIAAVVEGIEHRWLPRHRWRTYGKETKQEEEARFKRREPNRNG